MGKDLLKNALTGFVDDAFGQLGIKELAGALSGTSAAGVKGSFSGGVLSAVGTNGDDGITFSRDAAGKLLLDGGGVTGGTPTVANTTLIQAFGQGGNDVISINETNGALPKANLFGGAGNDTLTGGSGADLLFGQGDNDTLFGKGGADFLFGGAGDDMLTGGDADDQMFGEAGNDRMIWNPGDDSDLMEGGAGTDTAEVNGGNGAETFTLTANGTRVRLDRVDPAPFNLDIGTTEKIVVNMNGGNDTFSATGNLAALIGVTVDGGSGDDTILGSNGNDLLLGGADNDFIDGQQGADTALLGAGDDMFQWDPGDGNDVVEGGDGSDSLLFNGSAANETFAVSANGGRALFTRNVANIVMDLNDMETIEINALSGADTINVGDMSGTDVTRLDVDLAAPGGAGDAQPDTVTVNGTAGADEIDVVGLASAASVLGLAARVDITGSEGANDSLVVNGGAGKDSIVATSTAAGTIKLTLDGGAGDDTIFGGQGADVLLAGADNDFVFGDNGNDLALLGSGDDLFQWDPGDGSDTIEGQAGTDQLLFFGSNASENVSIVANGGRALLLRDVANVTMDMDDLETIEFRGLGGADNIIVGDMTGTDVKKVEIGLRGANGGGDGAADTVTASGTQGGDVFGITGDAGGVTVFGLSAKIDIFDTEAANDRVVLNGLGGSDVIDASSLEAGAVQLTINGGLGDDVMLGSAGSDIINGGDGDDAAFMGAGDDLFIWNPGDDNDVVEGQEGFDTLLFNGSNASENVVFSANGGRVLMTRDIANVVMDLNDVESADLNALGGADTITVNDLSGTDLTELDLNLGGADGLADTVIINATGGDDIVLVLGDGGGVQVLGLAATVNITGFDALDRLIIRTHAGDDVIEASGLAANSILFTGEGGADDDILIGGERGDVLLGGNGDDVLIGGGGLDVLDGGTGDNVVIQGATTLQALFADTPMM